jgi:hypothetical protein
VIATLVLAAFATSALGQTTPKENAIKAAFVFNFIKFAEWSDKAFDSSDASIKLCVWGSKALDGALDELRNKTAKNRKIRVLYTQKMREVIECHVLFVSNTYRGNFQKIITQTAGENILTVSDIPGFAQGGGIIGLFLSDNQMRFAINVEAARRSEVKISSQLLRLGKIVSIEER